MVIPMRLATFFLIPAALLTLAACATPREACISAVSRDARVLDGLIAETRANLSRGYAIAERQEVRTVRSTCQGRNPDGTRFRFACPETVTTAVQEPVAIDLDAERAKLASLEQRQAQNAANQAEDIRQCVARHPE